MKRFKTLAIATIGAGVISGSAFGIVSAATTSTNPSADLIPRSVVQQERLEAAASVLNTSTNNVINAHKNHTLNQLISAVGLTRESFRDKLHAALVTDLEAKGYSQTQINQTLKHELIGHLRGEIRRLRRSG